LQENHLESTDELHGDYLMSDRYVYDAEGNLVGRTSNLAPGQKSCLSRLLFLAFVLLAICGVALGLVLLAGYLGDGI